MRRALAAALGLTALAACGRKSVDHADASAPSASASAPALPSGELVPRLGIRFETVDGARSVDFSADRRFIAVAEPRAVIILDRATLTERARVSTTYPVGPVAFSADGQRVAVTGGPEGIITVHDTATGDRVGPAFSKDRIVRSVALSRDGAQLAVGLGSGEVVLRDVATGAQIAQSVARGGMVLNLGLSPDGRSIVAGNDVLEVPSLRHRYDVSMSPWGGAFIPAVWLRGGSRLVASCEDGKLCVFDAADGRLLRVLLGRTPFAAAADDRAVVYVKGDAVVFQDVETGAVARRFPVPDPRGQPVFFSLSADDRRASLFRRSETDPLAEWDLAAGALTRSYAGLPVDIAALAFADEGRLVVATTSAKTVTLGRPPWPVVSHGAGITNAVALLQRGSLVARASGEHVEIWDRDGTAPRATVELARGSWRTHLAASTDGSVLAAAVDGHLTLWDPEAAAPRVRVALPSFWDGMALSPHGALAVLGAPEEVHLVDTRASTTRTVPRVPDARFHELAFSPDGARFAAANAERVWLHVGATGEVERMLAQERPVGALAFSPDSRLLAVGTEAGTITLWDAASGERRGTLEVGGGHVEVLAFSPEGKLLASSSTGGKLALSRVSPPVVKLRFTPLRAGGQTCARSPDGKVECFGEGAEEAMVCRFAGQTQAMDLCAETRGVGLVPWGP